MFWKRCDHEWHEVGRCNRRGLYNRVHEEFILYCPKCDRRREETESEWKAIEKAQKIKAEYLYLKSLQGGE